MLLKSLPVIIAVLLSLTINQAYCAHQCNGTDAHCGNTCQTPNMSCDQNCCHTTRLRGTVSQSVLARLNAGAAACRQGDLELAANCYKFVLEQNPHNTEALYGAGRLAELNGQLDQALLLYQRAAVSEPANYTLQAAVASVKRQLNIPVVPIATPDVPALPVAQTPCPDLCIANSKRRKSSKVLKILARAGVAALSSAASSQGGVDLGCPICRILH